MLRQVPFGKSRLTCVIDLLGLIRADTDESVPAEAPADEEDVAVLYRSR